MGNPGETKPTTPKKTETADRTNPAFENHDDKLAQLAEINAQILRLEQKPNSNGHLTQKPSSKISDGVTKGLPIDYGKISPTKFQPSDQRSSKVGPKPGKIIFGKEKNMFRTVKPKTVQNFNPRTPEPFEKPKLENLQREYDQIFKAIENFDSAPESVDLSNYEFDEIEKERMLLAQRKKFQSSQSLGGDVNLIPKESLAMEFAPAKDVAGIIGKFEANLNEDLLKMKIQFLEKRIKAIEGTKDASPLEIEEPLEGTKDASPLEIEEPLDTPKPEQALTQQEFQASTDREDLKSKKSYQVGTHGEASESNDNSLIEYALQESNQ